MNCAICGREPKGYQYTPRDQLNPPTYRACSMVHLLLIEHCWKTGDMPDITKLEAKAVDLAIEEVGAYIEATGTTDLAAMTPDQFNGLVALSFERVAHHVGQLTDENAVPF